MWLLGSTQVMIKLQDLTLPRHIPHPHDTSRVTGFDTFELIYSVRGIQGAHSAVT